MPKRVKEKGKVNLEKKVIEKVKKAEPSHPRRREKRVDPINARNLRKNLEKNHHLEKVERKSNNFTFTNRL